MEQCRTRVLMRYARCAGHHARLVSLLSLSVVPLMSDPSFAARSMNSDCLAALD